MDGRRLAVRLPALLLGTGLALVPALALAPAAYADGTITTPGAGTVFDEDTTVRVEARVDARTAASTLQVVEPGGAVHDVDSVPQSFQAQTLSYALDTSCPAYPGLPCSGRRPAANGTWTVRLTGGSSDSRTFSLRIAPKAPVVSASATGPRTVVLSWERGVETDLLGYTVVDGSGDKVADGDDTCSGGTCRTTVTYDSDGPRTETLAVRATRACPDCGGALTATSAPVRVDRPAPPAPEPTPESGGTGGTPGAGSGTGTDGATGGGTTGSTGGGTQSGSTGGGTTGSTGDGTTGSTGGGTTGGGTTSGGSPAPAGSSGGTPTGDGTPSSGGGTDVPVRDDAGDGTTTPAQAATAFALGFSTFGPKLGLPKLPPLPATGGALPDVASTLPDGSYDPNLPFGSKEVTEQVPTASASGPVSRVTDAVSSVVDTDRLLRSLAGALVLLGAGAHVRRFLAQDSAEQ